MVITRYEMSFIVTASRQVRDPVWFVTALSHHCFPKDLGKSSLVGTPLELQMPLVHIIEPELIDYCPARVLNPESIKICCSILLPVEYSHNAPQIIMLPQKFIPVVHHVVHDPQSPTHNWHQEGSRSGSESGKQIFNRSYRQTLTQHILALFMPLAPMVMMFWWVLSMPHSHWHCVPWPSRHNAEVLHKFFRGRLCQIFMISYLRRFYHWRFWGSFKWVQLQIYWWIYSLLTKSLLSNFFFTAKCGP